MRAFVRNDLVMGTLATKEGKIRLVSDGRIPVHTQHVLDILLAQVFSKGDDVFRVYTIGVGEFFRLLGVARHPSPAEIKELVAAAGGFTTLVDFPTALVTVRWMERAVFVKETRLLHFQLSEQLRPFLLSLKGNYTQLRIADLLRLKTASAHQLYCVLARFANLRRKAHHVPIETFCDALHIPADHTFRGKWRLLNKRIIKPAIGEVAARTGMLCKIRPVRLAGGTRGEVCAVELSEIRYEPDVVSDFEEQAPWISKKSREQTKIEKARQKAETKRARYIEELKKYLVRHETPEASVPVDECSQDGVTYDPHADHLL
jgi:hypothetical protein